MNAPNSDKEDQLLKYLNDTKNIRYKQKSFHPLDIENQDLLLTEIPWSLDAVSVNIDISTDELKKLISRINFLQIDHEKRYAEDFTLIKIKGDYVDYASLIDTGTDIIAFPKEMPVASAMNTYIFAYLLKKLEDDDSLIPVEEAIFSLKNSIIIPDDFMPDYLMSSVEGSFSIGIATVSERIQPLVGSRLIYIFPEFINGKFGRVRFLYPSLSTIVENLPSLEVLQKTIGDSFSRLQGTPPYKDFELSRCLKDVIYSIEVKHTRTLAPPLFNSVKLALLSTLNIIESSSTGHNLKPGIEVDRLKMIVKELKDKVSALSASWLESEISIQ